MWGNHYPVECQRDLSEIPAYETTKDLGSTFLRGARVLGYWVKPWPGALNQWGAVVIASDIDPITATHVRHHELCHALMWQIGDGNWHR
jgi:hypothetical protein